MLGFLRRRRHAVSEVDLSAYLDGRLSPDERRRLEEHLRACPACARRLEGLRAVVAELRELPRVTAPRSFALTAEQVGARHERRPVGRPIFAPETGRLYLALRAGAVAAAVLLFATVGADIFLRSHESGGPGVSTRTTMGSAQPSTASGETYGVTDNSGEGETPGGEKALPSTVVPEAMAPSVLASPTPQPFAKEAAAGAPTTGEEGGDRQWLWVLEGAAGGLALGLGLSAFWLRRLWRQESHRS